MRYIVFALALVGLAALCINSAFAEDAFFENYYKSQTVLVGKVLSLEQMNNETSYQVQVEKYYKNPQSAKVIAVFGPPSGPSLLQDQTFDKGDRLFLYLEQKNGRYEIQGTSFRLEYDCDASGLVPPPVETYTHGMPASEDYLTFSDADFSSNIYKVGNKMQIKYTAHNYTPLIKYATITLLVSGTNQNKTVFSEQRTVTVPACNGSAPVSWDFTPQKSDDYVAQVKTTAGYDAQKYMVLSEESSISNSFSARANVACCSLDRTEYPVPWGLSPLEQIRSGIPIDNILCKDGLVKAIKASDNSPACVKQETLQILRERGWAEPLGNVFQKPSENINNTAHEFEVPKEFSTGHKLLRIGSNGEKANLAEYFDHDSSIMLFYEYCNCTESPLTDKKMTRSDSQILDVNGISVIAYPQVSNYAGNINDKYVFEFYYDGYRVSLHTDQKLDSGLSLVKEILSFESNTKESHTKNTQEPYTTIEISFGNITTTKLLPVVFSEITHNAENLDKIQVWGFELIGHNADDRRKAWDLLPQNQRIFYRITDEHGTDVIDKSRMPENWGIPGDLHIYSMDCDSLDVKGESAHPTSFAVNKGTPTIIAKNSNKGILPISDNMYSFEFASLFETTIKLPENAEVISQDSIKCQLTQSIEGDPNGEYTEGYYTKMVFRLEN